MLGVSEGVGGSCDLPDHSGFMPLTVCRPGIPLKLGHILTVEPAATPLLTNSRATLFSGHPFVGSVARAFL